MIYDFLFLISVKVILIAGFLSYLNSFKELSAKIKKGLIIMLNGRNKEEASLLIDIGSGSIGLAISAFQEKLLPQILYSSRSSFAVTESPDASNMSEGMKTILNELLSKMTVSGFQKNISSALVTFSSPWFVSKIKNIHVSDNTPFFITQSFLNDIALKEGDIFSKELSKNDNDPKNHLFEVIERSIADIKINGYSQKDIIGKKTNTLDASLCLSVVDKNIRGKISDIILQQTSIPKEMVVMHTFPLVSFFVIRDIFPNISDFMIMDVTGEVTDLTVVIDNNVSQTVSFPYGRNSIIRQIIKSLNMSSEVAESTLRLYASGGKIFDSATLLQIKNIFINIENDWTFSLKEVLANLSVDGSLPKRLYLTTDNDIMSLLLNFLKSTDDSLSVFRKKMDIVSVDDDLLKNFYQSASGIRRDEFMAILSIFYNKIVNGR